MRSILFFLLFFLLFFVASCGLENLETADLNRRSEIRNLFNGKLEVEANQLIGTWILKKSETFYHEEGREYQGVRITSEVDPDVCQGYYTFGAGKVKTGHLGQYFSVDCTRDLKVVAGFLRGAKVTFESHVVPFVLENRFIRLIGEAGKHPGEILHKKDIHIVGFSPDKLELGQLKPISLEGGSPMGVYYTLFTLERTDFTALTVDLDAIVRGYSYSYAEAGSTPATISRKITEIP